MSVRDIELQIHDIYGYTISESTVSNITAKVQSHISEMAKASAAGNPSTFVVWMDGMVFKVSGKMEKWSTKQFISAVGLNSEGHKDVFRNVVG